MDAGSRKRVTVEVNTFFKVTAFGKRPVAGDGLVTDVGEEEQIAMPVMQTFAEVQPGTMQGVHKRGFHQAGFVDRTAW